MVDPVEFPLISACIDVLPLHKQILRILKVSMGDQLNVFEGLLMLDVSSIVRDLLQLRVA